MGRQGLLEATVGYVRQHGIGEMSLRQLADAIGSSHRMLLYHFGSWEGLLAAVVDEIEEQERGASAAVIAGAADPEEAFRRIWARLRAPRRAAEERLFFELAAMTAQERPGTESFVDSYVAPWVAMATAAGSDPVQLRLDVATLRGLLLDLLVTRDRRGVDAAFERWLSQRLRRVPQRARSSS